MEEEARLLIGLGWKGWDGMRWVAGVSGIYRLRKFILVSGTERHLLTYLHKVSFTTLYNEPKRIEV